MSALSQNHVRIWRVIFICTQAVAIGYALAGEIGESIMKRHDFREFSLNPNLGMVVAGIVFVVCWAFLFFASPFFFRSLRWVAWIGWAIAILLLIRVIVIS
jgi:Trk-type K+ transport system membrane component